MNNHKKDDGRITIAVIILIILVCFWINSKYQSKYDDLESKYATLEDEHKQLQEKYDDLEAKYDNLQEEYDNLEKSDETPANGEIFTEQDFMNELYK